VPFDTPGRWRRRAMFRAAGHATVMSLALVLALAAAPWIEPALTALRLASAPITAQAGTGDSQVATDDESRGTLAEPVLIVRLALSAEREEPDDGFAPISGPIPGPLPGAFEQDELDRALAELGAHTQRLISRLIWPLQGEITTYFGEIGPTSPRGHAGLDIANDWGAPVRAAKDGGVVATLALSSGYGWHVIVDHGDGLITLYAHLSSFEVEEGQAVARGDVLGTVGSTGYSTGPHLHFEVRRHGQPEDPLDHLP
jgi:murein DD-endopeptidase MepM/ murein hydrolase activator NlpD